MIPRLRAVLPGSVPDEGLKISEGGKLHLLVEAEGAAVGDRHGQRNRMEPALLQFLQALADQVEAETRALRFGIDTDLSDVADAVSHHGGEHHPAQPGRILPKGQKRAAGVKAAASGIVKDVIQKTHCPGVRAVLVVNGAIDVPVVGARNQMGRLGSPARVPGSQRNIRILAERGEGAIYKLPK